MEAEAMLIGQNLSSIAFECDSKTLTFSSAHPCTDHANHYPDAMRCAFIKSQPGHALRRTKD